MTGQAAPNEEIVDLYRELILDHARHPRHFGRLENATHSAKGINPLCGDKLCVYLRIDDDEHIDAMSFEGSGCAISLASASLLTDTVIGLPMEKAEAVFSTVTRRLTQGDSGLQDDIGVELEAQFEKIKALDGVREFPSRVKCATLAWHALHSALRQDALPATTE